MEVIKIDSELTLRAIRESDAGELFRLVNRCRPYLSEWLPWVGATKFEKDTFDFILSQKRAQREGTGLSFVILKNKTIVGMISYISIQPRIPSAEIGYWLGEKFQGEGIMLRACKALVGYGFTKLKFHRIVIQCAEENHKSRAIPEKLNFKYEGTRRDSARIRDVYLSLAVYSMISHEFEAL